MQKTVSNSQFHPDQFPPEQVYAYGYVCAKCGAECEDWTLMANGTPRFIRKLCDPCDEADAEARQLTKDCIHDAERRKHYNDICPEIYRASDRSRLPMAQLSMMMRYEVHECGLLCMGDSRKGKTRCAWLLMEKLVMKGHQVEAITEVEYSIRLRSFKTNDVFRYRLCNVTVLFLDDLGHVAAGQKHLEELYHVVEYRTSHKKPIICTTQFSGDEMNDRSGRNKTMAAIINRLREFCDIVNF